MTDNVQTQEVQQTKIVACDCKHDFQDERYGRNNRVHNRGNKGYKCTVCGKIK